MSWLNLLRLILLAGSSCWGLVGGQVVVAGIELAEVAGVELAGWLKLLGLSRLMSSWLGLGWLKLLGLSWLAG